MIGDRPVPLGAAVGHAGGVPVSDVREAVRNEDIVTFTATFAGGAVGTFSVSRIAYGLANSLGFDVFCEGGAAAFGLGRVAEFTIADFLDEICGMDSLPRCASLAEGLHKMRVLDAVVAAADEDGKAVAVQ